MTETLRHQLHKYIDQMDDFQLQIVLGFIKKLFHLSD